ncbi:MAG: hypothetical protein NTZ10_00145 [Candidatus Saganbacteria bacterium]|nr:hypothetical protein [Candidatus Saganbacteria bacterium]
MPTNIYRLVPGGYLKPSVLMEKRNLIGGLIFNELSRLPSARRIDIVPFIREDGILPVSKKQMVILLKPELCTDKALTKAFINKTLMAIAGNGYKVQAISAVSGPFMKDAGIIERHYGVINRIFRLGAEALPETARKRFTDIFGSSPEDKNVFSGKQAIETLDLSAEVLMEKWMTGDKPEKLAPGMYAKKITIDGPSPEGSRTVCILNGFHAVQLSHFTSQNSRVIAMLIASDSPYFPDWWGRIQSIAARSSYSSSWAVMRNDVFGATDPTKAKKGSLRERLLRTGKILGVDQVDFFMNGWHLSAGPVESINEAANWFGLAPAKTVMGELLVSSGLGSLVPALAGNCLIQQNGGEKPVFDVTEGMEPDKAIDLIKEANRTAAIKNI